MSPLLHCTRTNTSAADTTRWNNFVVADVVSQRCETITYVINGVPVSRREDVVTVKVSHGAPYSPSRYAGQPAWVDYWIPGHRGYTSGAGGTFDSTGQATLTFRILSPKTGSELNILASGRFDGSRTFPAHDWATISC